MRRKGYAGLFVGYALMPGVSFKRSRWAFLGQRNKMVPVDEAMRQSKLVGWDCGYRAVA